MLEKQKNQEKVIMMFFVVVLISVGIYVIVDRSLVDVVYLLVLMYYFGRFLKIKKNGK